jgi:hypothetical protein
VKVFIFAELDDYDFIFQDNETNSTGRIAAFDPFRTATHELPKGSRLPTFWIAGLRAGQQPLLSPPNLPHMVITAENCVMVEERRLSVLFLDEMCYFMSRAARWHTLPILYFFLKENLCDPNDLDVYVSKLIEIYRSDRVLPCVAACAFQSLLAVREFDWHPQFTDMGLDRSLLVLREATMKSLNSAITSGATKNKPLTLRRERHLRCGRSFQSSHSEITDLGDNSFASVVHIEGRAVWGPVRFTISEAHDDHLAMQLALESNTLDDMLLDIKTTQSNTNSKNSAAVPSVLDSIFGSDSDSD